MASAAPRAAASNGATTRPGLLAASLTCVAQVLAWLFFAWIIAIAVEWLGMRLWWPEEGLGHSRRVLETELRFLEIDFRRSLVSADPVHFVRDAAARTQAALSERPHFVRAISALRGALVHDTPLRARMRQALRSLVPYGVAAVQVSALFAARLATLALALPLLGLLTLVGLVDGLVRRDLRRWGGGRESSFVYHWAKRLTLPLLIFAAVLYLAFPYSVHPSAIAVPFTTVFAVSLSIAASTFKKYL
jgi:integrating conjugative element membrane protein (TIGR03747 family)